jgi:hypothetical protein
VSTDVQNLNLFETNEVCSHQLTNKVQLLEKSHQFSFAQEEVWQLSLMDKYKVEAQLCPAGQECNSAPKISGKWSPIYA